MERRALLRGLAALATSGTLAGCANNTEVPVTAPDGPLNIRQTPTGAATPVPADETDTASGDGKVTADQTEQRFVFPPEGLRTRAGSDGKLVVALTVRNRSPIENTALVEVIVGVGTEQYVGSEFVTLEGGAETSISVTVPVSYERYDSQGGSINIDVTRRTPETPTPTDYSTGTPTDSSTGTPTDG